MLTLKTAQTYGDADVTQVIACDGDNMLIIGTIHRVEYPAYMNEPTHWGVDLYLGECKGWASPFTSFDEAMTHARNQMDDISKAFYAR